MTQSPFRSWEDFFYPGTEALRNKPGVRDAAELERFERGRTAGRLGQLRAGTVVLAGRWDLAHLQAIHAHVFGDVYESAGQLRSFPLFKGGSEFCRPEYLGDFAGEVFGRLAAADHLRGRSVAEFVGGAADLLADLNALHPFREGNGRSQRAFVELVARYAGHEVVWPAGMEQVNTAASVDAMRGDNRGLTDLLSRSVTTRAPARPTAAQVAARSLPRSSGRVRPAKPTGTVPDPSRRPKPPGLSL